MKEIIEQAGMLAKRFEEFEPDPKDKTRARSLAAVHRAAIARADAEAALADAVVEARRDGNSWAVIGTVIGTTGEAARQRYGRHRHRRSRAV